MSLNCHQALSQSLHFINITLCLSRCGLSFGLSVHDKSQHLQENHLQLTPYSFRISREFIKFDTDLVDRVRRRTRFILILKIRVHLDLGSPAFFDGD
jgi:hypothetical protein